MCAGRSVCVCVCVCVCVLEREREKGDKESLWREEEQEAPIQCLVGIRY